MKRGLVKNGNDKSNGFILITGDEKKNQSNNELVDMMIEMNVQCSSDSILFFIINKNLNPVSWIPIYKSESVPKNISKGLYFWKKVQILTSTLCKEEEDRPIKLEVFKSFKNGKHQCLASTQFTLAHLKLGEQTRFTLENPKNGSEKGHLRFQSIQVQKRYTFLEYIFGGCEISLAVAVDYTLSNGDPNDRNSLHYFDLAKNEYLRAIESVGQILQYYDSDK